MNINAASGLRKLLIFTRELNASPIKLLCSAMVVLRHNWALLYENDEGQIETGNCERMWFQQDGATFHTLRASLDILHE